MDKAVVEQVALAVLFVPEAAEVDRLVLMVVGVMLVAVLHKVEVVVVMAVEVVLLEAVILTEAAAVAVLCELSGPVTPELSHQPA